MRQRVLDQVVCGGFHFRILGDVFVAFAVFRLRDGVAKRQTLRTEKRLSRLDFVLVHHADTFACLVGFKLCHGQLHVHERFA